MKDEFNFSEFAQLTGKHRDTISKRVKAAKLKPSSNSGGKNYYLAMEVLPLIYDDKDSRPKGYNPDELQPQELQQHYAAMEKKFNLDVLEGKYVLASEVSKGFSSLAMATKEGLDMIPVKAEQTNKFTVEQLETLIDISGTIQSNLSNLDIEQLMSKAE